MRIGCVIVLAGLIAACSSGGGDSAPSPNDVPPENRPPTISGSPATQVIQDQPYSFTPTASDPDGDTLTFSISSQPSWASFDTDTGSLAGTPGAASIGTTPGVTISVSDGTASASLASFDLEVQPIRLGSATVSWDMPTTNADGTLLTDLAGYRVHYGETSGIYTAMAVVDGAAATSATIEDLTPGTWFFVVTAVDRTGNESARSLEVSKVVDP